MVTTRHSLPYAKEIVDEYRKHNFHWIRLRHLDSLGFAQNNKNIHYSAQEYLTFWKSAMDYLVSVNKDHFMVEGFIQLIMRKLKGENPFYSDFQSPCGAILNQLAYSYNGDIYTCDEGRQYDLFKLGNVFSHSYKEIVQSDQSCAMISSSVTEGHLCDACVYKPFCGICPVCIYSEENNLIPKLAKNQRCMIYKGIFDYLFSSFTQPAHKKTFFSWINEKV
jgi:radical SAM protein with 4Fe4S-binding SPASM domain